MKVELGAGKRRLPGYLALDMQAAVRPDVLASMHALPFADGSIEQIRAVDCLEHASYRATDALLAEWARVMKPEGALYVQVPSFGTILEWYAARDDRLLNVGPGVSRTHLAGAVWRIYGGHSDGVYADGDDWLMNAHFAGFTASTLEDALARAGFAVWQMVENGFPNLMASAIKR